MKSFIGDMDIETCCVCVRFNIDYYYYYYYFPALHFSLCRIFMSRIFSRPHVTSAVSVVP